ncbi:MAG: MBL fold metallo-hydrolase [Clostridia bacterium]|nr:MBL fold metallo-hydrolase [Clostridia bacterium]
MLKTWEGYLEPFQIFGNLYFVGNRFVSSHIIDTGEGLVLLDSNHPECLYMVTEGMRKLGLDPANITHILHSHGHFDHIGGTRALVEMYGCKTIIGREDVPYVTGEVDLTWAKELGYDAYIQTFCPDIVLDDGDVFTIGNTTFRAVSTPGHTPGTMSYFFNVQDGDTVYTAAMFGGAGMNSMKLAFLNKYGLPHSLRENFPLSLEKVKDEQVDILIGNHPGDVDTAGKWAQIQAGEPNPFIDTTALTRRLAYIRKQYDDMIASGE